MIFQNNPPVPLSPLSARDFPVRHGFFTRQGGVSTGLYASLNGSLNSADLPQNTLINRQRIAAFFGLPVSRMQSVRQTHGNRVITLSAKSPDKPFFDSENNSENESILPPLGEADALVTDQKGLILSIITADCAPVLFYDPTRQIIAAAHAGRKGAFAGILEATLTAVKALGGEPSACLCAIGPCIQQKSYEISENIRSEALAGFPWAEALFCPSERPGHFLFDLPGFCEKILKNQNVKKVISLHSDTFSQPELFFSYRRKTLHNEPVTGHQISALML